MQAYQACVGPPVKAPPLGIGLYCNLTTQDSCSHAETGNEELGHNKVRKSRLVFRGSDAQVQSSYEDTVFPIEFAALRKFNASFQDVNTAYIQADATASPLRDSPPLSGSASFIANLNDNFEIAVPGPSRGDR